MSNQDGRMPERLLSGRNWQAFWQQVGNTFMRICGVEAAREQQLEYELWRNRRESAYEVFRDFNRFYTETLQNPAFSDLIRRRERAHLEQLCVANVLPVRDEELPTKDLLRLGIAVEPEYLQQGSWVLIALPEGWTYEPTSDRSTTNAHIVDQQGKPKVEITYRDEGYGTPYRHVWMTKEDPEA